MDTDIQSTNSVTMRAYGKINLGIDVLGKLPSGYHQVEMIMQQISLWDEVTVSVSAEASAETAPSAADVFAGAAGKAAPPTVKTVADTGTGATGDAGTAGSRYQIRLSSNKEWLPADSSNIAYKAAELMIKEHNPAFRGIVSIELKKGIPVAAGLAGGSADGAAVIHALKKLWSLPLSLERMMELGLTLGADVPFCVMGQQSVIEDVPGSGTCALAQGIGEQLTVLPPLNSLILLSKPARGASTAEVYGGLDLSAMEDRPDTSLLIEGLKENNLYKITLAMGNVLEGVTSRLVPEVKGTREALEQQPGAVKVLMSGSGPTVYAIFNSRKKAEAARKKLLKINPETYLVRTLL